MSYLFIPVLALLAAFNVYASRLALRSRLNDRSQKRAQLLLIWLVPVLGAFLTAHVHKSRPSRGSWFGPEGASTDPGEGWAYAGRQDDCTPGDPGCGE